MALTDKYTEGGTLEVQRPLFLDSKKKNNKKG